MVETNERCPVCFAPAHESHRIAAFEFVSCPRVPPGFVYIDDEPKHGPRGQLIKLAEPRKGAAGFAEAA